MAEEIAVVDCVRRVGLAAQLMLASCLATVSAAQGQDEKKPVAPVTRAAPASAAPAPAAPAPATAAPAATEGADATPATAPAVKKKAPPKKKPAAKKVEVKKEEEDAGHRGTLGLALKGGIAAFSGDFSNDKQQSAFGLMMMGFPDDDSRLKPKAGLADRYLLGFEVRTLVDLEFTGAKQDGSFLLVAEGEKAEVTLIAVDALFCALADLPVQLCPYLGFGHMLVNDGGDFDATFGVLPYGVVIPYKNDTLFGTVGLLAGVQLQFYSVTRTVLGETARADVGSLDVFAGVIF